MGLDSWLQTEKVDKRITEDMSKTTDKLFVWCNKYHIPLEGVHELVDIFREIIHKTTKYELVTEDG